MFDHRIENRQQLSHAGDQGNLWSFACVTQPFVESSDPRITSAGNQGSHVERCPYVGSATPDSSTTSQATTIPFVDSCFLKA
jgi:hypothetical protein